MSAIRQIRGQSIPFSRQSDGEIRHVTDTAFLVAQYRAIESDRADAIISDEFAARLAGEKGKALADASPAAPITGWILAVRTVVIDAFIADALELGVTCIVNLGAGLDARPYRMDLPESLTWIEADFPEMIDYKRSVLEGNTPRCRLEQVGVDLSDDSARRNFLNQVGSRGQRTLVLTEGVIPYLSNDQVDVLASDLHSMAGVELWIADYFSHVVHRWREQRGVNQRMREAPFLFKPDDWFVFFRKRGWKVRTIRYLPVEGKRLGRPFPVPKSRRSWWRVLLHAVRPGLRRTMATSLGFAMMEPIPIQPARSSVRH